MADLAESGKGRRFRRNPHGQRIEEKEKDEYKEGEKLQERRRLIRSETTRRKVCSTAGGSQWKKKINIRW